MRLMLFCVALFGAASASVRSDGDLMPNGLPGTSFTVSFKQYSGYLNYNTPAAAGYLHYWYIESQNNVANDPLIVFTNGGPGCSSVFGMMEEIGPFRVYPDGRTLYENVFSWNKAANLLVIDGPGVGFSPVYNKTLQDQDVADFIESALDDFLVNVFPERQSNQIFVGGEGYGAIYATLIAKDIQNRRTANRNLKGVMLGNGLLNSNIEFNTLLPYAYMHGFTGKDEWDDLRSVCCVGTSTLHCDYSKESAACQNKSQNAVNTWIGSLNNPFNVYEDCYANRVLTQSTSQILGVTFPTMNSTDNLNGYPCYAGTQTLLYINQHSVKSALHVDPSYGSAPSFNACVQLSYGKPANDITLLLSMLMNDSTFTSKQMRVLIYNGDLDSTHNFISAQLFADKFSTSQNATILNDGHWSASYNRDVYKDMEGGLATRYSNKLDVVSIRGAGHFAPQTRPSQTLQVIRNFLTGQDYSNSLKGVPLGAQPLLPAYQYLNTQTTRKTNDQIYGLPGLTFQANFNQYSGYLKGSDSHFLHYWLVESQVNPSSAPLLLWLNGGPGSSSVWGMLTENGPFRPNPDGMTLYENPYSWNKFANVLYLEAPYGVGYSYSSNPSETGWDDDSTSLDNYRALKDFFSVFPEYQSRPFFITGESYGGVYIPTLSKRLLDGIYNQDINVNFQGIAIGNAELTTKYQVNSVIFQLYTYGVLGRHEYDQLVSKCCNMTDPTQCDFYTPYIVFDKHGNYIPANNSDPWCASTIIGIVNDMVWNTQNDPYNVYQDCYSSYPQTPTSSAGQAAKKADISAFKDQKNVLNLGSTDAFNGFPCWGDDAAIAYMNLPAVRKALHIPDNFTVMGNITKWQTFNADMNANYYNRQYFELDSVLSYIINNFVYYTKNMRMLIYNGDADLVCNHLGDQWFIENFAANNNLTVIQARTKWRYRMQAEMTTQLAGFEKKFSKNLRLVTVKGSGHLVPLDRPGPALQMIFNFVNNHDVGVPLSVDLTPAPLLPNYNGLTPCQPAAQAPAASLAPITYTLPAFPPQDRVKREVDENYVDEDIAANFTAQAQADQITQPLPGLTFTPTYRQFSGYLTPSNYPTDHLFYWFMESQSGNPSADPVLLWLNGGPGCSSLLGLFTENGPYHNNDDPGQTLYENVFAWNKQANVLFMEAPVEVGFSYTEDTNYTWNDITTADRNAWAIKYFFDNVFPEYASNEFYVSGESYGGVYVPTLSYNLINMIEANILKLNFKGLAIGNGILSEYLQTDSEVSLQYGRGLNGIDDWNQIKADCGGNSTNPIYYQYSMAPEGSFCDRFTNHYIDVFQADPDIDPYNIYQDCYAYPPDSTSSSKEDEPITRRRSRMEKTLAARKERRKNRMSNKPFTDNNVASWYGSTDPFHGFPCYNDNIQTYLNRKDVQNVIHAKLHGDKVWSECFSRRHYPYHDTPAYYDMSAVFHNIMNSNWYLNNNMRILLYNGDIDTVCQFLGDQWFAEYLTDARNMTVQQQRQPWFYQQTPSSPQNIAGYFKSWNQNFVQMTVKGAGHMVPMDRPAVALQMINNFLVNSNNYSNPVTVDLTPQPMLPDYVDIPPSSTQCSRKDSDRVIALPGLPKALPFAHYSGFLKASNTHYLHYWLATAETNPDTAPLLLWLNGGPGSSSLEGMFQENGPFRLNKDRATISLNQYAWNKFANVFYMEAPVGVGYSYTTDGQQPAWNDVNTADENYAAIQDFFTIYPEYINRPFYVTGESYGGIYLPMLTERIINGIQNGSFVINFMGTAIGNAVQDKAIGSNTLLHTEYYRAGLTYNQYQLMNNVCCYGSNYADEILCPYSDHVTDFNPVIFQGNLSDPCYDLILKNGVQFLVFDWDPYNLYQQCYTILNGTLPAIPVGETWTGINYDSTDPNGGYWCYMSQALSNYMNMDSVRRALNIPDGTGGWIGDTSIIAVYQQQYNSTSDIIQRILTSDYYKTGKYSLLYYSGDADEECNWLSAEWFTNMIYKTNLGLPVTQVRQPWTYQSNLNNYATQAGFYKRYASNIDVVTVKGAGHFVPLDRPAQAQQMMYNWLNKLDYSTPFGSFTTNTTAGPVTTQSGATVVNGVTTTSASGSTQSSISTAPNTPAVATTPAGGATTTIGPVVVVTTTAAPPVTNTKTTAASTSIAPPPTGQPKGVSILVPTISSLLVLLAHL